MRELHEQEPPLGKGRVGGVKELGNMTKIYNRSEEKIKRQELRRNMPLAEVILWSKLKGKGLGYKFRRQYSVDRFIVDFYCPALKLAIEVDGDSHYTEAANMRDKARQDIMERYGCLFLRFTNKEIYENSDGAVAKIMECISGLTSPTPPCKGGDLAT